MDQRRDFTRFSRFGAASNHIQACLLYAAAPGEFRTAGSMIYWVDAQLPPQLASWLSQTFKVEAYALRDLHLRDAYEDGQIFQQARHPGIVIMISKDSDFVEMVLRLGVPPQLLWVTCGNVTNRSLHIAYLPRYFFSKAISDGAACLLRIFAICQRLATQSQPGVEFSKILKLGCRCKQPLTDIAHLVFNLAFFPARFRRTGHRFKQIGD